MKKLIAMVLVLATVLCLGACGGTEETSGNSEGGAKNPDVIPTTEAKPTTKELAMNGITTIGEIAEVSVANAFVSKDVMPPKPGSFYTHYEASSGNTYVVVIMDVKNLGETSVDADDILATALEVGDMTYQATVAVETEDGASLESGYSEPIQALETARLYQMFSVPENSDLKNLTLVIFNGEENYRGNFSLDSFKAKIETIDVGSVVTDDETISLTIDNIEFKNALYPPQASGYYHYYEAASGKTYLIVKMTVKNLKGTDMKYDSIAGVTCVYNGKYNYSFFAVLEEDGGQDLNGYPSQYAISPLDQGVVYYLAEVPAEVANGPVEISFYIAGNYYKCSR